MREFGVYFVELLRFVESRIPMLEHDFAARDEASEGPVGRGRRGAASYCFKQAFFYQAEWWCRRQPLVSEDALTYARKHWPTRGHTIWTAHRSDVVKHEGRPISESGLIWEHVYTGGMFGRAIEVMWRDQRALHAMPIATLLADNYQTAWITRDENARLNRSDRGTTLVDALNHYADRRIRLAVPPEHLGHAQSVSKIAPSRGDFRSPRDSYSLADTYDAFFVSLNRLMKGSRCHPLSHSKGRHYAYLQRSNPARGTPEVCIELRGSAVDKDVYLSIALPTELAWRQPGASLWMEARAQLGEGGEVYFGSSGRVEGKLCRYRVKLTSGLGCEWKSKSEINAAARRAAALLHETDLNLDALQSTHRGRQRRR
jgi:hypothetical protein